MATSLEQLKYNYDNLNNDHTLLNKEYNLYQKNSKRDYDNISNKLNSTLESFNKYKEISNENYMKINKEKGRKKRR